MCSHVCVQSIRYAVVITLCWHWMGLGRMWGTVLVPCALCFHREGEPMLICGVSDDWRFFFFGWFVGCLVVAWLAGLRYCLCHCSCSS